MDRLTQSAPHPLPADSFCRCQLCGHVSDDICEFHMWLEANDDDSRSMDCPVLITCHSKACDKVIKDHERLYVLIPWSRGGPGRFMLLCGDCNHREGSVCTHAKLKANGGDGLLVIFHPMLGSLHICFTDGRHMGPEHFTPATHCEGHPDPGRQPSEEQRLASGESDD